MKPRAVSGLRQARRSDGVLFFKACGAFCSHIGVPVSLLRASPKELYTPRALRRSDPHPAPFAPCCSSGSTVTVRRGAPELDRSSLALAALPLARHCSDTSSSSPSSASISGGGYDSGSESEFGGFTASLSSAVLTGMGEGDELCSDAGSGVGGLPHQRRALASIKTTHRLRVGVLEGTTFLNQVGGGWDPLRRAAKGGMVGATSCMQHAAACAALWPAIAGWSRCCRGL